MNFKLIFGIFIPLVVIISLVFLSGIDIGFSIEKETEKFVQFNSLFTNQYGAKNSIPVQTITITNDFFMSKRFELPKLTVCLSDKEGLKQRQNLQVKYSEGKYSKGSDVPIFSDLVYGYSSYSSAQGVDIPANGKKQVKILVEPLYIGNAYSYADYDELLLIQPKGNKPYSYSSCYNLDSKELDNAIHINITDKSNINIPDKSSGSVFVAYPAKSNNKVACTDSDGGKNYYVKGVATGLYTDGRIKGWIMGDNPNNFSGHRDDTLDYTIYNDHCFNNNTSKQLDEGYCDENGLLQFDYHQCPVACKDGICVGEKG